MVRQERLELPTYCLEGSCSIQLSYWRRYNKKIIKKSGAGDGNRTHATSLEGWDSTIELHPQINNKIHYTTSQRICQEVLKIFLKKFSSFLKKHCLFIVLVYYISHCQNCQELILKTGKLIL